MSAIQRRGVLLDGIGAELVRASTGRRKTLTSWLTDLLAGVGIYVTSTGSTTARTLADRFAEVFNIKDYGATAASSDNYAALNLAIAACNAAGGGTIYIPEGTFIVLLPSGTGLTTPNAGTRIVGAGKAKSILQITPANTSFVTAMSLGNGDIDILDLTVQFLVPASGGATLFQVGSRIRVERCDLSATNASALGFGGNCFSWPSSGTQNDFDLIDTDVHGFYAPFLKTSAATSSQARTLILGGRFYENIGGVGANSPAGTWQDFAIIGACFEGDVLGGSASFASVTGIRIASCSFTGGQAIHIEENCGDISIVGNEIVVTVASRTAIALIDNNISGTRYSPHDFVISGNVLKTAEATTAGIHLLDATGGSFPLLNGRVVDNKTNGFPSGSGVLVQTTCASITVEDNSTGDAPSIAAAATIALASVGSRYVNVTGSGQTPTAFGLAPVGLIRFVRWNGANTLTHNGTSLILPGGANITTAADDVAAMVSLGSGNWLCMNYKKASGQPVVQVPISTGVSGLGTNVATFLATPSSANLAAAITDEDGTGLVPFEATGTWTPELTFATPGNLSITYTQQLGIYTKIGRMVFCQFEVTTSAFTHTTASGNLTMTGLPFTSNASLALSHNQIMWTGITKAGYTDISLVVNASATTALFVASASASAVSAVAFGDVPSGGTPRFRGTIIYTT